MVSTVSDYSRRRKKMLDYLGGLCINCSTTENLQIDHKDATTKSFCVSKNWSIAWTRLAVELDKCQILCKPCHYEKSVAAGDVNVATHGTGGMYRHKKCRCEKCKAVNRSYHKRVLAQLG